MRDNKENRKYYLYGAGINAFGVVKYLGKENILGVIDSNDEKIGMDIDGIPIIGIKQYLKEGMETLIIISAFQRSEEVVTILREYGIKNYLVAPYLQAGFQSISSIVKYIEKKKCSNLVFANVNLLTLLIIDVLIEKGLRGKIRGLLTNDNNYISRCHNLSMINEDNVNKDDTILLTEAVEQKNKFLVQQTVDIMEYIYNNPNMFHEELGKFKNKHKGERCFIIGTGPSLRMTDLDKLAEKNEICFGSNKIYLAYEKTNWRPDYYMVCDFNVFRSCYDVIKTIEDSTVFIEDFYNILDMERISGSYLFRSIHQKSKFKFSRDVVRGIYSGLTVTYNMIQMAVYMGFTEIYLLGVDFSYNGMAESKGNHFSDQYIENTKMKGIFYEKESLSAYKIAENESHNGDYKIFNATRGGRLEVFERKNFDDLF